MGNKEASSAFDWHFDANIQAPLQILIQLGIDVWSCQDGGSFWSQDVLQTIYWRMANNANASTMDLGVLGGGHNEDGDGDGDRMELRSTLSGVHGMENWDGKVHLLVLSPNYLFFNHSCRANTSWHGTVPNVWVGMEWLMVEGIEKGMGGDGWVGDRNAKRGEEILKPGSGSVICRAGGEIKEGEELMISYVGNPVWEEDGDGDGDKDGEKVRREKREQKRGWLTKWFENGCGCELCEEENRMAKRNEEMRAESDGGDYDE